MKHLFLVMLCLMLSGCGETSVESVPSASETIAPEIGLEQEIAPEGETETGSETPLEPEDAPLIPEEITYIDHQAEGGEFELPLSGTTGFAGVNLPVYDVIGGTVLQYLAIGQGFQILEEAQTHWRISFGEVEGWVDYRYCLVNLPDLLPSIIYENPYANICYSCSLGKAIPHVTGERLYEALYYNPRLEKEEYLTPVLYQTAKKINVAQKMALAEGNSLLIYECFRPMSVQNTLVKGLAQLMNQDAEVKRALTTSPWSESWFVAYGVSTHQEGSAVDLTLVRVLDTETHTTGQYQYEVVSNYEEHTMPTQFDELSPRAAAFSYPVSPSGTAWKSASFSSTMTAGSILLHNYCTQAGLTPLASEWWHFNDNSVASSISGEFTLSEVHSVAPVL